MLSQETFDLMATAWMILAILVAILLQFVSAPYGRHARSGWGPMIPNNVGWIVMELPALVVPPLFFLFGSAPKTAASWLFIALWVLHYGNRTLVFPLRIQTKGKKMPLSIPIMAIIFNSGNGFLIGYHLGVLNPGYDNFTFTSLNFLLGITLFFAGMAINIHSDNILISLRKPTSVTPPVAQEEKSLEETVQVAEEKPDLEAAVTESTAAVKGYKIPYGGLFRWVSAPNLFGEVVEWTGFAIMTWSLATISFAVWTAANVLPRAVAHHKWYKAQFPEYPPERRAVIPFIL